MYTSTAFFCLMMIFRLINNFFHVYTSIIFFGLPIIRVLKIPHCAWGRVIMRPRTRSAAVRHWRDLSLSAYERDLVTNEKV